MKIKLTATILALFSSFLVAIILRFPMISSGLPYFYDEDEAHHFNRIVNMVKDGEYNPHYFLKPSLNFYIRMPVVAFSFLYEVKKGRIKSIKEVDTRDKFGVGDYAFSASHMGMVKWNRAFSLLLGLGSIYLTFLITLKLTGNIPSAWIASLLVAISPALIQEGIKIGVDSPTMFFALLTAYLSLCWHYRVTLLRIIILSIVAGLTVSCKYNAAPIVAIPVILAFLYSDKRYKFAIIAMVFSAFGFLVGTPYCLVSLPLFLDHIAYEIWHYSIAGHEGHMAKPGIQQVIHYGSFLFKDGVGLLAGIIGTISLIYFGIKRRSEFFIILLFPALYFLLMIGQKANFTRNMLLVIPFLAIGCGVFVNYIQSKRFTTNILLSLIPTILFIEPSIRSISFLNKNSNLNESRLEASNWIGIHSQKPLETAISGQLQFEPTIYKRINAETFDEKTTLSNDLFLSGYDFVISSKRFNIASEDSLSLISEFDGTLEPQRIVKNPAINIYKALDYFPEFSTTEKLLKSNRLKSLEYSSDTNSICKNIEEGHCWLNSRASLLPIKNPARTATFEVMSPWDKQFIKLNNSTATPLEAGKWQTIKVELDPETIRSLGGIVIEILKVRSPKLQGLNSDDRRLGVAIKNFIVQ